VHAKTEIDLLEKRALEKLENWAAQNEEGLAIWISPPCPGQNESRFIVYELKKIGGEKIVDLHAICGYQDAQGCLEIAEQVLTFSGADVANPTSPDLLRETPIPFSSPPYSSWEKFLEEVIGPPEVWEKIRKKEHIKEKKQILRRVDPIVDKAFPKVKSASSRYEYVVIGAQMERQAQRLGYEILDVGPCGISNTLFLTLLRGVSPFTVFHSSISTLEASFDCPRCHRPIPSGQGITTCPHCGAKKEDYGKCV
jgi:hypothetical protein